MTNLYTILDLGYVSEEHAASVTAALLAGGAGWLQLRAKGHDLATIRRVAETLIPLCRAAAVPFILNDHPALAAEIGADGVHIGQDDGSLADARALFHAAGNQHPSSTIQHSTSNIQHSTSNIQHSTSNIQHSTSNIQHSKSPLFGRSTHSLEQARAALEEGFDYIGFGPLFPTPTKLGRPGIGLADIAEMERDVGSRIPAFCIGGIKRANLPQVLAAGARRVVIVSDLLTAPDISAATREVREKILEMG